MMQTMIMHMHGEGLQTNKRTIGQPPDLVTNFLIIAYYIYATRRLFNQNMYFTFVTVMHPPVQVIVACPPLGTSFWFCSPGLV